MKLTSFLLLLTSCAALAATEENITKNFNVASDGTLVVEVAVGSIEVVTNATGEVTVEVWRKVSRKSKEQEVAFLRDHPVEFNQDENSVSVRCRPSKEKRGWFEWVRGNRTEAKYTIRVPAQFNTRLNTAGGGINVSDVTGEVKANTSGGGLKFARIHGPLNGSTSGGGIRVSDSDGEIKIGTSGGGIEVSGGSGSLKGHTSGGQVTVKTFNGPVSVSTSGGGITIENVTGRIEGSTSGGGVNAILVSPVTDAVKLSTSGGGVTVKIPESASFTLDASTSGGGVTCDLPVTVQGKLERQSVKGTVNNGGPEVVLRTSGGGIHVKKL